MAAERLGGRIGERDGGREPHAGHRGEPVAEPHRHQRVESEVLDLADNLARSFGGTNGTFDELSISVTTDGSADSDLYFRLDAPAGLYSRAELRFIGADLIAYIRAVIAADPQLPVGALDVVSGAERDRVLTAPNDTNVPMPGLTIPELFGRQAERAPEAVAVVSGDSAVSYRELDQRSSRVAEALRRRGVGCETVVAVAMPRSIDLVVALLGVVKAGGAYLPIDPAFPAERIRSVAGDASAQMLLTDATTAKTLSVVPGVPAILFDEICAETAGEDKDGAREAPVYPDNLLAVMTAPNRALLHRLSPPFRGRRSVMIE